MAVKNGFNLKTIHKLIRKQKSKQNKITALSTIETSKPFKILDGTTVENRGKLILLPYHSIILPDVLYNCEA